MFKLTCLFFVLLKGCKVSKKNVNNKQMLKKDMGDASVWSGAGHRIGRLEYGKLPKNL